MKLETLAGNAALKKQLSAQAEGRGLSHAYLISGPGGAGKTTLARLLAAAMVCTGGGEVPCGTCPGCKKALSGIHPDVITVGDDGKDISVAQARAVRSDAYIRPNEAERKVYIFENAQSMNASAQNALLKLLEEGPPYAAFLLLTDNPGAVLTTIRSRCEGLTLSPVSQQEAEGYLLRRFPQKDPKEVRSAAARCDGLLGKAVEELEGSQDDGPVREAAQTLLELLVKGDELSLAAWAVSMENFDREQTPLFLDRTISLLGEALVLQSGGRAPEENGPLLRQAAELPRAYLLHCVAKLEQLRTATQFNVGSGHLWGALAAGLSRRR
jgi:DNA polymerase-3 subunit delta'